MLVFCVCESLEFSIGPFRISGDASGSTLAGFLASKTIYRLVRQARAQHSVLVGSTVWSRLVDLAWETPRHWSREPVDKLIQDLFPGPISVYYLMHRWIWLLPCLLVYGAVTDPKAYGDVAEFWRVWSCFYFCSWDHSQRVRHLDMSPASKCDFPESWTRDCTGSLTCIIKFTGRYFCL